MRAVMLADFGAMVRVEGCEEEGSAFSEAGLSGAEGQGRGPFVTTSPVGIVAVHVQRDGERVCQASPVNPGEMRRPM